MGIAAIILVFLKRHWAPIAIVVGIIVILGSVYWWGVKNTEQKQEVIGLEDELERVEEAQKTQVKSRKHKKVLDEHIKDENRDIFDRADELSRVLSRGSQES